VRTTVIVAPFDLYGGAGCGEGANLLGDALQEILDDVENETSEIRSTVFSGEVTIRQFRFENLEAIATWRETLGDALTQAVDEVEFLLWLGGNHLSVLPVYDELGKKDLVLQFDAHLDVQQFEDNIKTLNHGNFLLSIDEATPRIINIGHRDLFVTHKQSKNVFETCFPAEELAVDKLPLFQTIKKAVAKSDRVWIDIDCDAFDPAYFPAVQQPLPFGLVPAFVFEVLQLVPHAKLAGISISEFDPGRDDRDRSLSTLVWFLERVLLLRYE
jgi:agmatinase